jgi:hypothetical protein
MQITMLIPLFESLQASSSHPAGLLDAASDGAARQATTRVLQQALRETGIYNRIVVTEPADRDLAVVAVELPGRCWFALPMPNEPHVSRGPWLALASWISLIITGAVAIALALAHWVARPLALLESVASTISQSGQMAVLPETGPAEVKATAHVLNRLTANLKVAMESRMRLVAAACSRSCRHGLVCCPVGVSKLSSDEARASRPDQGGASRSSRNVGFGMRWMRVAAGFFSESRTKRHFRIRQSRVVLMPRRWHKLSMMLHR